MVIGDGAPMHVLPSLSADLALLVENPPLELLAAAEIADELLAGRPLPFDVPAAIRERARLLAERAQALPDRRDALLAELSAGLRHASTLPLRPGLLAALAASCGMDAFDGAAREAAQDVASGIVQLVSDPNGAVADLADAVRQARDPAR